VGLQKDGRCHEGAVSNLQAPLNSRLTSVYSGMVGGQWKVTARNMRGEKRPPPQWGESKTEGQPRFKASRDPEVARGSGQHKHPHGNRAGTLWLPG